MILKTIEFNQFRNYETLQMRLDPKTNILFGDNAQGKTNILEAVYLSGTTKSHRGAKDREMIRFGQNEAHIRSVIEKCGMEYQIDIHLKKNKSKGIAINKVPIRKAGELFGILNLVVFSPEDLNIIKDGPAQRRRFMDVELCQLDKIYLHDLSMFHRVLNQRNKLLKDIYYRPELKDTLDVWDSQLLDYGSRIILRRQSFMQKIGELVSDIHHNISAQKENLIIRYEPDVTVETFEQSLKENLEKDIRFGQTNAGPHRDDISFLVDEVDIRRFGSQGQQRSCALSLKLSEIELVKEMIHDTPILLLDDVLSELDSSRQHMLLNSIHDIQTIITCTGLDEFVKNRFQINKVFQVVNGTVQVMNE